MFDTSEEFEESLGQLRTVRDRALRLRNQRCFELQQVLGGKIETTSTQPHHVYYLPNAPTNDAVDLSPLEQRGWVVISKKCKWGLTDHHLHLSKLTNWLKRYNHVLTFIPTNGVVYKEAVGNMVTIAFQDRDQAEAFCLKFFK